MATGPLPPAPGVLKTQLVWTYGEDTNCLTNLHFHYSGSPPGATDLNNYAATVSGAVNSALAPQMSTSVTLTSVNVTDLSSATGAIGSHTSAIIGILAAPFLPASACFLTQWIIGRRYKGGHPRTYWPLGHQASLQDPQIWGGAAVTAFSSAVSAFRNACLGVAVGGATIDTQVNVSYYSGFTVVTDPVTGRSHNRPNKRSTPLVDQITGFKGSPRLATQRRRLLGIH